MSYLVYYHFADSFSDPIICPKGTFEKIKSHLRALENELGFKYEYDESGAMRWASIEPSQEISDEVYCAAAIRHNAFVRKSYHDFEAWFKSPVQGGEEITPEMSKQFLHGLAIIFVPFERWNEAYKKNRLDHLRRLVLRCRDEDVFFETKRLTKTQANALVRMVDEFFSNKGISKNRDDYVDTMRELYDSLRGQNDDSGAFVDIPLEPKQARQVIWWMGEILKFDRWEAGLDVPLGSDYLSSGYDGGHEWCETCGAILREDVGDCTKRKCPLREEFAEDFLDA